MRSTTARHHQIGLGGIEEEKENGPGRRSRTFADGAYETPALPLSYTGMAAPPGFDPGSSRSKRDVLTKARGTEEEKKDAD